MGNSIRCFARFHSPVSSYMQTRWLLIGRCYISDYFRDWLDRPRKTPLISELSTSISRCVRSQPFTAPWPVPRWGVSETSFCSPRLPIMSRFGRAASISATGAVIPSPGRAPFSLFFRDICDDIARTALPSAGEVISPLFTYLASLRPLPIFSLHCLCALSTVIRIVGPLVLIYARIYR